MIDKTKIKEYNSKCKRKRLQKGGKVMKGFDYWTPVKIHFGTDVLSSLASYVPQGDVLLIIDRVFAHGKVVEAIRKNLDRRIRIFTETDPNPSLENVRSAIAEARAQKTMTVIGLGGGSNMDVAKITACFANNDRDFEEALASGNFQRTGVRLILIPTTAGTGSEVTNVGVFTDLQKNEKRPIRVDAFYADDAFIDPALTFSMPKQVTANTGMDAFCHAIEAYWNKNSNPMSDAFAKEALALIFANLKRAYDDPQDTEAREHMALASLLAGLAFSQTKTTAAHVFSYPITAMYHVAHGQGCAVSIAALIRHSVEKESKKMQRLGAALGFADVEALAHGCEQLIESVSMSHRLSSLGAVEADIDSLVRSSLTYEDQLASTPMTLNAETIRDLLKEIL